MLKKKVNVKKLSTDTRRVRRQEREYEGSKNERQRGVETDELRGTGGNMGKERDDG